MADRDDPWASDEAKQAVRAVLFKRAAEKDRRAENGITGRVDFMLDQMNEDKRAGNTR